MMAYCVKLNGKLLIDTTYEHEEMSKFHFLAFCSGDYDQEEFYYKPGALRPSEEFLRYPDAMTVQIAIQTVEQLH